MIIVHYLAPWSLQSALRQSLPLIRNQSHLRLVGMATDHPGVAKTKVLPMDSSECFGQGRVINGVLIGRPDRLPERVKR